MSWGSAGNTGLNLYRWRRLRALSLRPQRRHVSDNRIHSNLFFSGNPCIATPRLHASAHRVRSHSVWAGETRKKLTAMTAVVGLPAGWPDIAEPLVETARQLNEMDACLLELEEQQQQEKDPDMRQLYDEEVSELVKRRDASADLLETELLRFSRKWVDRGATGKGGPRSSELDDRNAIMDIAPGVGGTEAALFARDIYEMYQRYAASKGWKFETQGYSESQGGGLQSATVRIAGGTPGLDESDSPYSWLRYESGVHRVQRVPETDRKGRMQTSSATVVVIPVAEESDVEIEKKDLNFEITKKSSGPGGQSVNACYQAVRLTHLPTGISVFCATSQSQHENRRTTVEMLRTKLLQQQSDERANFERSERKEQRGTGDRSEKIRTYNFQRSEVVEHRLLKAIGTADANDVLFGNELEYLLEGLRGSVRDERLCEVVDRLSEANSATAKK